MVKAHSQKDQDMGEYVRPPYAANTELLPRSEHVPLHYKNADCSPVDGTHAVALIQL
jgi:hypothetical protein